MMYQYRGKRAPEPVKLETPKCGTNAGYRYHRTLGTAACQECKDAHAAYEREWRRRPRQRQTCATYAGYMRHKRADENACETCLVAYADYMHQYRARKKVAA